MPKNKPPIPTDQLIKRLHLMADTGGMLTRDRIEAVRQAADRLEQLDERIAIMTENSDTDTKIYHMTSDGFNYFGDIIPRNGGDVQ